MSRLVDFHQSQFTPNDMSETDNWGNQHSKKILLGINLGLFLFAEFIVRLLAMNGYIAIVPYATSNPSEYFFADIDPDFGVWHQPNHVVEHESPCFDVEYASNTYGARDKERSKDSTAPKRVLVLGDSFVEGYGVNTQDRMTDLAEKQTGVEFLNFGSSGDFGSTQQLLLYKKFASGFQHTAVAIFFLPANDFEDNNPAGFPPDRYRPYLVENKSGGYDTWYPVKFEDRQQPKPISMGRRIRRTLYNNIYIFNLFRQIGAKFEQSELKQKIKSYTPARHKADATAYTEADLKRLFYTYQQMAALAGDRKLTIFVIPTRKEMTAHSTQRYDATLLEALRQFATTIPNLEVVDLLPDFAHYAEANQVSADDFFYDCDPHWSPLGNRVAASVLARLGM